MRDERLERQSRRGADRDDRWAARVDGFDDLGVVDALGVDRGDAEVAVTELTLDETSGTPSCAISTACAWRS
jgi:hypothetical protein